MYQFNFRKNLMVLKTSFQWIIGISCGVVGVIIYIISKFVGFPEEYEQNIGTSEVFIHYFHKFNRDHTSYYINNITESINNAKKEIKIQSRYFAPINFSHPLINSLINAIKNRSITCKILTYQNTDTSLDFFKMNGLEYRVLYRENSSVAEFSVSDFIIIDDTEYLHLSNFFEESNYTTTNLIGIRIKDKTVVEDATRIFNIDWDFLSPEESKKLPPHSLYWPYKYMPLTQKNKRAVLKDKSEIYLTIPSAKYLIPNRDIIKPTIQTWLSNLKNSEILISCSYFEMPFNSFFENALVNAISNNSTVKLLLSNNMDNETNLLSAGLLAPFQAIKIKIGEYNSNYANYMIIDDTIFFVSDSITGRLFRDAFGIGLVAKSHEIVNSVRELFTFEYDNYSTDFINYTDYVYQDDNEDLNII